MSRIDFKRLDELFNQAITLPRTEWPQFIKQACGEDEVSARQLLAMLSADQSTGDQLGQVVADQHASLQSAPIPDSIGSYKVVRELGRGGMGAVYLCERKQADFTQQVAVKLLRTDIVPAYMIERFGQERRMLASLSHHNIASLIDAGETESGQPYVVMEHVNGDTLTRYASHHNHGVKQRVQLFLQLCDAVTYAHRSLIIHRDLKPDNVLVTENGVVKLLDFGIAKLVSADGTSNARGTLTRAGAMTPPYASPEQVRGQPVSTQSDIYSLGAVLYELLTGQLPYAIKADISALELERQICETNPSPPSHRQDGPCPPRQLKGDLDNIVLKAMRKEPERRYGSVAQLAEDLQRFLDGLPVSARPNSLGYRVSKLVTRNPVVSGVSVLLVFTVLAFAVTSRWQAAQTALQRDKATQEAETANQVADFMIELFQVSDPVESSEQTLTARDLLDRAARSIDEQVGTAPLLKARLMHVIGLSYANLGDYENGLRMLEGALELREQTLGPDSLEVSDSLNRIGNFHRMYGRLEEAEQTLSRSLAIRERFYKEPDVALADSYNNFGLFQYQIGNYETGIETLQKAIDMHRLLAGEDNTYVAVAQHNMALAANQLARYSLAQELAESALAIKLKFGREKMATYANSMAVLAATQRYRGDFVNAMKHRQESLALRRSIYDSAHPSMVSGLVGMAALRADLGEYGEARRLLDEALKMAEETSGRESNLRVRVLHELGRLLLIQNDYQQAVAVLEEGLAIRQKVMRPDNPDLWESQYQLGVALMASGELQQAEPLLMSSMASQSDRFAADHPAVLASRTAFAQLRYQQEQYEESAELADSVVSIVPGEEAFRTDVSKIRAHQLLAELRSGDPNQAAAHRSLAESLFKKYRQAVIPSLKL